MADKYKDRSDVLKYQQMDVRAMNFADDTFDAVIDKATFDSVLVNLSLFSVEKTRQSMQEKWFHKFIEC